MMKMKRVFKQAAILALAVLVTVMMSACGAYADIVDGFLDAATYMSGESNVRTAANYTLRFSENAAPVSLARVINAAIAGDEGFLTGVEVAFSAEAEVYEDTAKVTLAWIGAAGAETLMTVIIVDDVIYIGMELLAYVSQIDELAQFAPMLTFFNFDYIAVDTGYLLEMMDVDMDKLSDMEGHAEIGAILRSAAGTFSDSLRSHTPQVLTKDIIAKEGDAYTLTLDAESAMQLFAEVLNIAKQNEDAIKSFLNELFAELTGKIPAAAELPEEMLEFLDNLDFEQIESKYNEAVADLIIGKDIPTFDFSLTVSGTGSGAEMKQTTGVSFVTADMGDHSAPFEMLFLEVDVVTEVTNSPITVPTGNILALEDLVALFEMLPFLF